MGFPVVSKLMKKTFGTRNERMVKGYLRIVDAVAEHENTMRALDDDALRAKTEEFRGRLADGETIKDLTPEVFAAAREAMDRSIGIRGIFNPEHNFDPSQFPDDIRRLYDETKALIDATPDADPEGEMLGSSGPVPAWQFVPIPHAIYDAVRALHPTSRPPFRSRPFDVQIIGAVVLSEGRIAEMKTGEGKTIVAPLAAYRAIVQSEQVHVVTVNDYLVQRDRDWTFPFFRAMGITVGAIHPMHMQSPQLKQVAYKCDVVYGTTAEFGFDYLRDNMKHRVEDQVQKHRQFAIVDEVDSTLIDEARTPLIISGPARRSNPRYDLADTLARHLVRKQKEWSDADERVQSKLVEISGVEGDIRNARDKDSAAQLKSRLESARADLPTLEVERDRYTQFYEVELDKKRATLTHEGIEEAQREAGVGSFYVGDNIDLPHLLEQSIRAHAVYTRDRDYVVVPDSESGQMTVVIVDQNTGRQMPGRQWSDGLHQAVEAKEAVPIKEETQTMATITIQNFFKLYDRLAGMTGTADTEATEFHEIYGLDVVVIPTNVPIARLDHDDLVYVSEGDKWNAIVQEIRRFHDAGRPVLVGTTSVEKSDLLSEMLRKEGSVPHEVLNAKQHAREADIILNAGALGSVAVATNMAGRGTDIKLRPFSRQELVDHWKKRNIAPKAINADMDDDAIIAACYRHMATRQLGMKTADIEAMSDHDVKLALLRHWAVEIGVVADGKASGMDMDSLMKRLDQSGGSLLHRLQMFKNCEELGGLHVVGTERHESRRIDNQLRGRSGRQGDNGSSRFFLSLQDDLMQMFAGPATLKLLSRLGLKEGDVIESPMLSRSVGRAQRKVEERNFLVRKNILEYDEVMDHQRHDFYSMRQDVLELRGIRELIMEHIESSVNDAVQTYLDDEHVAKCIGEWVHHELGVSIESDRLRKKDREDLRALIRVSAKEEAASMVRLAMGEYMPDEAAQEDWDLSNLADWANKTLGANVRVSELQGLQRRDIFTTIETQAAAKIDEADLDPIDQFIVPMYGEKELAHWANNKFGSELTPEEISACETQDDAFDMVMDTARTAWERRELTYPIEFAMEATAAGLQQDAPAALGQFCQWAKYRYELDWQPDALPTTNTRELYDTLVTEARTWNDERIGERARRAMQFAGGDVGKLDEWFVENMGARLTPEEMESAGIDMEAAAEQKIRQVMRVELTRLEQWILLQIVDQAWKDHLYAMDQLRESIGYRSFSQRDPRIEFKREGARLFDEMEESIRDKVTDLALKARLTAQRPAEATAQTQAAAANAAGTPAQAAQAGADVPPVRRRRSADPSEGTPVRPAQPATAAVAASARQRAEQSDIDVANQAGVPAGERPRPKQQPIRAIAKVGRNEPCPCGSGMKYKKCHGRTPTAPPAGGNNDTKL